MRLLVVTAVEAERDAVRAGLGASGSLSASGGTGASGDTLVEVTSAGVGMAAAAAHTSAMLVAARYHGHPYQGVLSVGIGGAFAGRAAIGEVALGTRTIAADLGADSPDGFQTIEQLGFGRSAFDADPWLLAVLRDALSPAVPVREGPILTVCTVTGTARRAEDLAASHPDAVAEAMEGYGVATAAVARAVGFAEVRTISNLIGPRDREAWRISDALAALGEVGAALGKLVG